jgi:antitoxin VapB
MGLNIKRQRTHELVRELADLRGVSQTDAIEEAVSLRIAEVKERAGESRSSRLLAIADEMRRLMETSGGQLSTDDLYDESGLPR